MLENLKKIDDGNLQISNTEERSFTLYECHENNGLVFKMGLNITMILVNKGDTGLISNLKNKGISVLESSSLLKNIPSHYGGCEFYEQVSYRLKIPQLNTTGTLEFCKSGGGVATIFKIDTYMTADNKEGIYDIGRKTLKAVLDKYHDWEHER